MRLLNMFRCSGRRWISQAIDPLPHWRIGARILVSQSELVAWIKHRSGRGSGSQSAAPAATPAVPRRQQLEADQMARDLVKVHARA